MSAASCDPAFGPRMLMGGKTEGNIGRERWLCKWIRDALEEAGFIADTESSDRIDIAIKNPKDGHNVCVIEAKFLFCHDCYQRGRGHRFSKNVLKDIEKRRPHGLPHQEIVLAADYQSMCPNGKDLGFYHSDAISSHLAKHGPPGRAHGSDCCGFIRFEKDLFEEFETTCDIFPRRGTYSPNHTWQAEYLGTSELIRAWVLGVVPRKSN